MNPATDSERVFEAQEDEGAVDAAVEAACGMLRVDGAAQVWMLVLPR